MLACYTHTKPAIPIHLIEEKDFPHWVKKQTPEVKRWLESTQFKIEAGQSSLISNRSGELESVIFIIKNAQSFWAAGGLPFSLPQGTYEFIGQDSDLFPLAWGLGAYQFTRYKKSQRSPARLKLSNKYSLIEEMMKSIYLVRDLINTPTDDMGPTELANAAKELIASFNGKYREIKGEALLQKNYAAIHTVGRASDDPPRLIDLRWGSLKHPKLTLVGKGVCFDSGGLDIKTSPYMLLMKKDMAGAAHALGLARLIMQTELPVCLRVLLPVVENVISGNAYRPGDIIRSRKGLTIEIGNTDAEGRVILADALTEAALDHPDLIIDFTTLTGAARVALGTELPAVFCNHDDIANSLLQKSAEVNDPIWRMPLFEPYRESLNTPFADINNCPQESYGGAITAALFLQEFVNSIPWIHFDFMAWNLRSKPGRPQGGEAQALRATFEFLREKFLQLS